MTDISTNTADASSTTQAGVGSAATDFDGWAIVVGLFGMGNLLNGLWMLASPSHWYINLPANVPGTGPLNEHFVRDIGSIFTLLGLALVISIRRPRLRLSAMVAASAYSVAHALVHVVDTARGLFSVGHWRFDVGPIYLTTIVLVLLTVKLAREQDPVGK